MVKTVGLLANLVSCFCLQLRDMVHRLLQSQPLDLANRLKALEPIVKEYFSLSNKVCIKNFLTLTTPKN